MGWQQITVRQFQELEMLVRGYEGADAGTQAMLDVRIIALVSGMTADEVDSLSLAEYRKLAAAAAFVHHEELPAEPRKYVTVQGRRYRFLYDVRDIRAHRYIEAKAFGADGLTGNLHKIAASMCVPQRRVLGIWRDAAWRAEDHSLYAADMQEVPITALYGCVVFFCNVFTASISSLAPFLKQELMATGQTTMTEVEIDRQLSDLQAAMDGLTRLHL